MDGNGRIASKPAEGPSLSSLRTMQVPPCKRPRCSCHGRGAIVFQAMQVAGGSHLPASEEIRGCYAAFIRQSRPHRGANAVTVLLNRRPIAHMSYEELIAGAVYRFRYDIPWLSGDQLQIAPNQKRVKIQCIVQPPQPTGLEEALNATMPRYIADSSPGTIHSPVPLLIVQPGNWVIGGFLAKFYLTTMKQRLSGVANREDTGR